MGSPQSSGTAPLRSTEHTTTPAGAALPRDTTPEPAGASLVAGLALLRRGTLVAAAGAAAARAGPAAVQLQLDQLPADPGALERRPRLGGEVGRKLDEREVGANRDVAEVRATEAALVGDRADDLARLDTVALADVDPVGRERLVADPGAAGLA